MTICANYSAVDCVCTVLYSISSGRLINFELWWACACRRYIPSSCRGKSFWERASLRIKIMRLCLLVERPFKLLTWTRFVVTGTMSFCCYVAITIIACQKLCGLQKFLSQEQCVTCLSITKYRIWELNPEFIRLMWILIRHRQKEPGFEDSAKHKLEPLYDLKADKVSLNKFWWLYCKIRIKQNLKLS